MFAGIGDKLRMAPCRRGRTYNLGTCWVVSNLAGHDVQQDVKRYSHSTGETQPTSLKHHLPLLLPLDPLPPPRLLPRRPLLYPGPNTNMAAPAPFSVTI